ncbi:MAG: PEP-CTERM sorting domain-containing protein [Crocosphaera sp.]
MNIKTFTQLLTAIAGTSMTLLMSQNNVAQAFTVSSFLPTGFTDEIAGITGYEIEDFEDTTLIPGLSVEWTSPDLGPVTTLPRVATANDFGSAIDDAWDGIGFLTPSRQGTVSLSDFTTLNFSKSPTSVGIGISNLNFASSTFLSINNTLFSDFSFFTPPPIIGAGIKSIYLRIDAEAGETIDSISIDGSSLDFLAFDRLAVGNTQSVPESSNILGLILVGGCFLFTGIKCKKNKEEEN